MPVFCTLGGMDNKNRITELEDVLRKIPLAHAMRVRVVDYSSGCLRLGAPAEPNRNHFGMAFGGAIQCLGTLAGWGLLWLELGEPGLRIVIQHAETTFKAPLEGDLYAMATLPEPPEWERFTALLERRGRARIKIHAEIGSGNQPEGAFLHGRYAVAKETTA